MLCTMPLKNLIMRNYLILLLTIFSLTITLGQETEKYIITKEQNSEWITEFKNETYENRIELLNKRFVADQEVYFAPGNPHGGTQKKVGFDTISYIRPLYIINAPDSEPFFLAGNYKKNTVKEIGKILNTDNIDSIELNEDERSIVLYGHSGTYGIINITLNDKNQYLELKKLIHNPA